MPNLIVLTGLRKGTSLALDGALVIGRSARAHLRLPDFLLSQEHAELREGGGRFILKDLESTNGTFRNGARVHDEIELHVGDVVHVGSTDLLFTDATEPGDSVLLRASREAMELAESSREGDDPDPPELSEGATPTMVLPLVHAVERAFSRARDLSGLLERIAVHFGRSARGRDVTIALRREDGGGLEVFLQGELEGMTLAPLPQSSRAPSEAILSAQLQRKTVQVVDEGERAVYSVMPTAAGVTGVIRVGRVEEQLDSTTLAQLDVVANLAGVYCRNHLLVEEMVAKNEALEAARRRLTRWNEELQIAVTARTQQLDRSMRSYRELFEESQDGNFTVDSSGRLASVNRRAAEVLGLDDGVGDGFFPTIGSGGCRALLGEDSPPGETFGPWAAGLHAARMVTFALERAGLGPDRVIELLVQRIRPEGEAFGLQCVVRDVTLRQRTEEAMRLLSRVVESVPEAVVTMDSEGVVTSWNPGAEALYGHLAAEVIGELVPLVPDARVEEFERLLEAARQGQSLSTRTVRVDREDREIPVQSTIAPIPDGEGGVSGVVEIARDLRPQLELEERMRWKERMASFGELATGLAHELGNPLANLLSGVGLLLTRPRTSAEAEEVHQVLHEEIQRLQRLVRQTLTLARWQPPDPKPVAVGELLDFVAEAIRPRAAEQGVAVIRDDSGDPPRVMADSDQTKQALVNLASNALEAMPRGGVLRLGSDREGARAVIEVRDTGVGIRPEDLPRVSDLYFSRRAGGSGIGLSIVKRIVEAHQGRIEVESDLGTGTTFRIALPLADAREGAD